MDYFGNVVFVVGLGLFGAILGLFVGAFIDKLIHKKQRKHEEE